MVLDLFHKSSDHRALGSSGPRTIGPSDHRTLGPSGPRTTGPSDYRALGIPGHNPRTIGPSDHRALGLPGPRTIGPSEYRATTPCTMYMYTLRKVVHSIYILLSLRNHPCAREVQRKFFHKWLETYLRFKIFEGDRLKSWCASRNPSWPPRWRPIFLKSDCIHKISYHNMLLFRFWTQSDYIRKEYIQRECFMPFCNG